MRNASSLAYLFAFALLACVSTQATRLGGGPPRPPVPRDQVIFYRTAEQVPSKYEEVALLSSSGDHATTSEEEMYESMRKKAGQMGANGVILQTVEDPGTDAKVAQVIVGTSADRKVRAIAIFVLPKDSSATKVP